MRRERGRNDLMMISTRGRYALRVMACLARMDREKYIPLKEITDAEEISQKYLEGIMGTLSKAGLVESAHGKGGGYRLSRAPEDYRIGEILRLTEGSLSPVFCVEGTETPCPNASRCSALPVWRRLDELINNYLDSIYLSDLIGDFTGDNYVI